MKSLSVIIPVYNCIEYLETCIESIISVSSFCQNILSYEIILVDDGSTDGSSGLCDQLAVKRYEDWTIQVIHQENSGVSVARNKGLGAANGEFILFIDSDDKIDSERLAKLIEMIDLDDSIDIAVFGMSFDYYTGNRIYRKDLQCPPIEGKKTIDECRIMLMELFSSNSISSLCNKLIRRDVIEDAGIWLREDMFLYEDLEFSLQIMARCKTFYFCTEPIYHYRQTSDEGNAGQRLKRIIHIPDVVDKIESALIPFYKTDDILLALYFVLAREKISCASIQEIKSVCNDFRCWIDSHGFFEKIQGNEYGMMLYRQQIYKIQMGRKKTKIRHKIANAVKKTIGDFRKG